MAQSAHPVSSGAESIHPPADECERCKLPLSDGRYRLPSGEAVCGYHYGVHMGYLDADDAE